MKILKYVSIMLLIVVLVASCAPAVPEEAAPEEVVVEEAPAEKEGKVCVILDSGGVDDKGYNQSAWEGAVEAGELLNYDSVYLVANQQTDWEKNVNEFLNSSCDLIIGVGFAGAESIRTAAEANPDQMFQLQDFAFFDAEIPNIWSQLYAMEEGSFLAGYLAAGTTETGKVGGFGGMNIPPVADFFIGFAQGIEYYNAQNGTDVQMYGWSNETLDGNFVGDFTDTEAAKRFTESLMDEGCDIILPQSGAEALAAAAAMKQRGGVLAIGADADQFLADEASGEVYLTTIMKNLGLSIVEASKQVDEGTFEGGIFVSRLEDGGLGLAPYHDHDDKVSDALKAELDQIKQDIIDGKIVVENWASLSAK
ncbi:MAG: BMP family ABC transporter substrate-binding protein [Anaerolineaceae bacterium]|nr:BMP family ABC transporter substrate-binding protein [Anaerolineaceae bacterium]